MIAILHVIYIYMYVYPFLYLSCLSPQEKIDISDPLGHEVACTDIFTNKYKWYMWVQTEDIASFMRKQPKHSWFLYMLYSFILIYDLIKNSMTK